MKQQMHEETPALDGDFPVDSSPRPLPPPKQGDYQAEPASLPKAEVVAQTLLEQLRLACDRIEIAGSIRRRKPFCRDVELVAISKERPCQNQVDLFRVETWTEMEIWHRIEDLRREDRVIPIAPGRQELEADKLWGGKKRAARYLRLYLPKARMKVDLFLCDAATWGAIYTIRTGSRDYVQRLVTHWTALTGGGHVKDGRLVFPARPWATSPAVSTPEEEDVFRAMRVRWTEPALRVDTIHVESLPCGHRVFDDRCDDCCAWAETAWRIK